MTRPLNRALVLLAFPLIAVPISAYLLIGYRSIGDAVFQNPIVQAYVVLLGITHFFLTFSVFLSSANRRHFTSTRRNVFAFIVAPLIPIVFMWTWYGLGANYAFQLVNGGILVVVRALDFHHLSRQAFGVLQLLKGPKMKAMPPWTRTAENLFLLGMAIQMFTTYKSNLAFDPSNIPTRIMIVVNVVLFTAIVVGYVRGLRAGAERKQTFLAFAYLLVQTGSCLLAVYRTGLYGQSLAVHYVEYHIIMAPRVLRGETSERDRTMRTLQRFPALLYVGLIALSGLWWWFMQVAPTATGGARVLVHIFDGIFVFHYIIEMSIWKFSDPYFRKSLGPLYT